MIRDAAEFARIYGSEGRVEWIKAHPCLVCGRTPSVNAHTRTGGTGRKADADTIIPLCDPHHREFDNGKKSFARKYEIDVADAAHKIDEAYRRHLTPDANSDDV